jgi:PSP1 C-terminal conserved region
MGSPLEWRRRAVGEQTYLIQYGVMGHVGRFQALPECKGPLGRGQVVVIQTDRGIELGEVLVPLDPSPAGSDRSRVLRLAGPDDLASSRRAEAMRQDRFSLCQRVLEEEEWPGELIDVEMLLDDRATVLHYLGPHQLDAASLRARFRMTCDFDVLLEPVGANLDETADEIGPSLADASCGSCGRSGGGCGSRSAAQTAGESRAAESGARGCGSTSHSGCASCGISRMMAARG